MVVVVLVAVAVLVLLVVVAIGAGILAAAMMIAGVFLRTRTIFCMMPRVVLLLLLLLLLLAVRFILRMALSNSRTRSSVGTANKVC